MILLYILILLFIVILSYKLINGDYFNLTFIFLAGYLLSAICCLYNSNIWGIDIQLKTILILLFGMNFFLFGNFIGKYLSHKKRSQSKEITIYLVIHRGNNYWKLVMAIAIDLLIIILLYRDIVRIASVKMVSWGNLFYNFRTNLGNDELGVGYSLFVNIGLRVTKPLAYIYSFIFCANIFEQDNRKSRIKKMVYIIPVIIYSFQVILQGYRIQLIALLIAIFFYLFFFMQINHNWKGKINFKYIHRIILVIAFICVGFYYIKFFIGKLQESNGVIAYVTNYLGGSLQLFDMYLRKPVNNGHETFAAFVNSLKGFGFFQDVNTVVQHEYRSAVTGVYIGNVYTGFRNYYNDFGLAGVAVLSFLLGIIFSYWYNALKHTRRWNVNKIFSILLYSSFLYTIVFHFFADYFFSLIGVGWFANIVIFYLLCVCIFKVQIKHKI